MISGLFISLLVTMYGASRFVAEHVNITPGGLRVGPMFVFVLKYLVPVQFAVMFGWWMYQAAAGDPDWWNPLSTSSVGTCILQWGVALAVLIAFNGRMARASLRKHAEVSP
jgi:NSS family neurotransmitter:Na+ symporter